MAGFFATHAKYAPSNGGGEYEVAEAGMYTCRLSEVKPEERPSFDNPDVMMPQFVWVFESVDQKDSTGKPYNFVKFTGVKYGNDNANLTKLIDGMLGRRLTGEEFAALDLGDLNQSRWKVMVDEITTGKGNQANKIISVKPAGNARPTGNPQTAQNRQAPAPSRTAPAGRGVIPTPPPAGDDFDDPFASE